MNAGEDIKIKIAVVIARDDGKVLLIKEQLSENPLPLWNTIKGTHERGETIFTTARRECREEVGLDVELIACLGVYFSQEEDKTRIQFNFLARVENQDAVLAGHNEQSSRGESIIEARWFTKEEIAIIDPSEFISARTYELLKDWIAGKTFPVEVCKDVEM